MGDLWGAFYGVSLGAFNDIDRLTTFADYRVPVVLRLMGVLRYSPELAAKVRMIVALSNEVLEFRFWRCDIPPSNVSLMPNSVLLSTI